MSALIDMKERGGRNYNISPFRSHVTAKTTPPPYKLAVQNTLIIIQSSLGRVGGEGERKFVVCVCVVGNPTITYQSLLPRISLKVRIVYMSVERKGELLPRCWGATEVMWTRRLLITCWVGIGIILGAQHHPPLINFSIVSLGKVSEINVGGVVEVERMVVG